MIKFSCKATGSFEMLDEPGKRLLALIGKPPSAQGIITTEQIPAAIATLRAATAEEHHNRARPRPDGAGEDGEEAVSLGQRAFPLIEMLERAHAAEQPVLWGV